MGARPWGTRYLSDEIIRAIAKEGRAVPKGSRKAGYAAIASKHGCSPTQVRNVVNGWIHPRGVLPAICLAPVIP